MALWDPNLDPCSYYHLPYGTHLQLLSSSIWHSLAVFIIFHMALTGITFHMALPPYLYPRQGNVQASKLLQVISRSISLPLCASFLLPQISNMAQTQTNLFFACILIMVIFSLLHSIDGRELNFQTSNNNFENERTKKLVEHFNVHNQVPDTKDSPPPLPQGVGALVDESQTSLPAADHLYAFRPTVPGQSPGVGHPAVPGHSPGAGHLYAFRPTVPGQSPGVGHPAAPGHSPGAGHLFAFRPTVPGQSPGVGHPAAPGHSPGAGHLFAFRPTVPGHSPGVGHPAVPGHSLGVSH